MRYKFYDERVVQIFKDLNFSVGLFFRGFLTYDLFKSKIILFVVVEIIDELNISKGAGAEGVDRSEIAEG